MWNVGTIVGSLLANALFVGFVAFLGKSIFSAMLAQDTKAFEADLKGKADTQIEKLKNELAHTIESYKVRLKKSEFLFQKEYEAASAFTALYRAFYPKSNRPDLEWEDALEMIANDFGKTEDALEFFLTAHGAVLLTPERESLDKAIAIASEGKFDTGDYDPRQSSSMANSLYETLAKLERDLIEQVRKQSSL